MITGCEINLVIATKSDIIKSIQEFYNEGKGNDGRGSLLDQAVENTYDTRTEVGTVPLKEISSDAELSLDKLIAKAEEAEVSPAPTIGGLTPRGRTSGAGWASR